MAPPANRTRRLSGGSSTPPVLFFFDGAYVFWVLLQIPSSCMFFSLRPLLGGMKVFPCFWPRRMTGELTTDFYLAYITFNLILLKKRPPDTTRAILKMVAVL